MTIPAQASNIYHLPNGTNFIIDPKKESDYQKAFDAKVNLITSIGETALTKNAMFNATVVRLLATGIVDVTTNNKRKSKFELLELLIAVIKSERERQLLLLKDTTNQLSEGGFSGLKLQGLLEKFEGKELFEEIVKMLDGGNYAEATIIKTWLPDIHKAIKAYDNLANDTVRGTDNEIEKRGTSSHLTRHYDEMAKRVNVNTNAKLVEHCKDRLQVKWDEINDYLENTDIFKAGWKELSIYIALATGRRQGEVHGIKTHFEVIDHNHLMFTGQLKVKDRVDGDKPFIIQTLVDSTKVVVAWERLCKLKPPMDSETVNKKLSIPFSRELPVGLRALFNRAGLKQYKDMRDTYAAKMIEFKPSDNSSNYWLARCMGHSENDLKTSSTYDKVQLV